MLNLSQLIQSPNQKLLDDNSISGVNYFLLQGNYALIDAYIGKVGFGLVGKGYYFGNGNEYFFKKAN